MKKFLIMLFFMCCIGYLFAQKKIVDSTAYRNWSTLKNPTISNNGHYVSYYVEKGDGGTRTLKLISTDKEWKLEVENSKYMEFSEDSQFAIIMKPNDSLVIVKLGKSIRAEFFNITGFDFLKENKREYLVFNRDSDLVLYDLYSGKMTSFPSCHRFYISESKEKLIVLKDSVEGGKAIQLLNFLDKSNKKLVNFWSGTGFGGDLVMDVNASQVAFLAKDTVNGDIETTCLYNNFSEMQNKVLFTKKTVELEGNSYVRNLTRFSNDGSILYFEADELKRPILKSQDYDKVNIWSYQDKKLQTMPNEYENLPSLYALNIKYKRINRLSRPGDLIMETTINDKLLLLHGDSDTDSGEREWNKKASISYYLVTASNGDRTALDGLGSNVVCNLSPGGRFVILSDYKNFYSYDIYSGEYRNLTGGIDVDWSQYCFSDRGRTLRRIAGWLENDEAVLLYDRYDVWLMDPTNKKSPVNITNGYGQKNNTVFTLALQEYKKRQILKDEQIILSTICLTTKENGFFIKNLTRNGDPGALTTGSYMYYAGDNSYVHEKGLLPIKARDAKIYIIGRMSTHESLNYFLTSDFKKITSISNNYPEKIYNWYTTNLYNWKGLDGTLLQGILYKPENFDSTKRYPLIFNYYEKLSFNLNVCLHPSYSGNNIDIPTYVSNGYLVFTPDIDYHMGDPMQGTYNSVISAAQMLSKLSFVGKMGIQGHSYGGIQTNYLVANSNIFKAACAASGLSDMLSAYGTISSAGGELQSKFQYGGQYRMGGGPWDIIDKYIKNSPVFRAPNVRTPLLIMHTTNDAAVPFSQAIEFFTALRRLGKKVWMLEYKDGNHSLEGRSAKDYTIRMQQFFDHYLKDGPAPMWMLDGLGAKGTDLKIASGLELDTNGRTPGPGLLTDDEQQKVDSFMTRKPITIQLR